MLRTLFSGITGLKNHQTQMDVLGNNIANTNTTGFKSGRTLFEDSLSQTMTGATRPEGLGEGMGGTNATQVGMGSSVAAVQTLQNQGNLQSTGQTTDLAIEGEGYFVVSDGLGSYFTRDGSMSLDAAGHLVTASGLVLQGLRADINGALTAAQTEGDIVIPLSTSSPASDTTEIVFSRNLDADSGAEGSIAHSKDLLCGPFLGSRLSTLSDRNGSDLRLRAGTVLTFTVESATGTRTSNWQIPGGATIEHLRSQLQEFLQANSTAPGSTVTFHEGKHGYDIIAVGGPIRGFGVTTNDPSANPEIISTFDCGTTIAAGTTASTGVFWTVPSAGTRLAWILNSQGQSMGLGLETGDVITIASSVGGKSMPPLQLPYDAATTTLGNLLDAMRTQMNLPKTDGTAQDNPTVYISSKVDDPDEPLGCIIVRGLPGTAFAISDLSITASNADNDNIRPLALARNMTFSQTQTARDTQIARTSIVTYDDAGYAHTVEVAFIPSQTPDKWLWEASVNGDASIVAGHRGTLTFGPDGTVSNFAYQDGSRTLQIDPRNGAGVMSIRLNPGSSGQFSGLTQFAAPTTAVASKQDGYTMGQLQSIAVSSDGVVQGFFDNGTTRALAKILIAQFNNPAGLVAVSGNAFAASANSGDPVLVDPATGACTIKPGTLEMSNVDVSREFANLIVTQRGYQANARVVSQADTFLEEVVNLVR